MARSKLRTLLRAVLVLIFAVSGVAKFFDLEAFADKIGDFGIVIDAAVPATALVLACAELGVAAALLFLPKLGALLAALLLVLFLGVLGYGIARGLDIDCGCLPLGVHEPLTVAFARDCAMLAAAGYLYFSHPRAPSTAPR